MVNSMNAKMDDKLFDLQCLLQRAEIVGNLGLESCPLNDDDQAPLIADLLIKIQEAQKLVKACADENK